MQEQRHWQVQKQTKGVSKCLKTLKCTVEQKVKPRADCREVCGAKDSENDIHIGEHTSTALHSNVALCAHQK